MVNMAESGRKRFYGLLSSGLAENKQGYNQNDSTHPVRIRIEKRMVSQATVPYRKDIISWKVSFLSEYLLITFWLSITRLMALQRWHFNLLPQAILTRPRSQQGDTIHGVWFDEEPHTALGGAYPYQQIQAILNSDVYPADEDV